MSRIFAIMTALMVTAAVWAEEMRPARWRAGEPVGADYPEDATWVKAMEIDDATFRRMRGKSFPKGCTVNREDLRLIEAVHSNGRGKRMMGEIVVNKAIADDVVAVLQELEAAGYPIERMVLIDNYDANDAKSMAANNTSGFCFRTIAGSTRLSTHAQGLAIDINPLYNPWVKVKDGKTAVSPEEGRPYADRTQVTPYTITPDGEAYKIFSRHGFTWGGSWRSIKDYQHFEKKPLKATRPRALQPGDRVGVAAPGSATTTGTRHGLEHALRTMGYEPVIASHTYGRHGLASGTVEERAADLNKLLRDTTVRAIVALRGGYGTAQLFDALDSSALKADPKWIVGFSDITALHGWALANGVQSVHGPVANQIEGHLGKDDRLGDAVAALDTLLKEAVQPTVTHTAHPHNLPGTTCGVLQGGNWIVANNLAQTPWDLLNVGEDDDIILFFEETNESIPAVERMLVRLHQAGIIRRVRGLIFGHMDSYRANEGFKTMEDAIAHHLREWGYYDDARAQEGLRPIVFNFPVGHGRNNMPLIEGARVFLSATPQGVTLADADRVVQHKPPLPDAEEGEEEEADDEEELL